MLKRQELDRRFDHHPPGSEGVAARHGQVRAILKVATEGVLDLLEGAGSSEEAALFVRRMEEAMFWANAAIARDQ